MDFVAGEALLVVNGDHPTAVGTAVNFALLAQEELDPFVADHIEVFDRAYAVAAAIALVEFSQPLAGIAVAFKAEIYVVLGQQFALAFEVRALLVSGTASAAVRDAATFLGNVIEECQVEGASRAIHTAGSDKVEIRRGPVCHSAS